MLTDADVIRNLLARYAELVDEGDLDALTQLFRHAVVELPDGGRWRGAAVSRTGQADDPIWVASSAKRPKRTKHLITNVIVEFEDGTSALATSTFTVLQETADHDLRTVLSGRYVDRFTRIEGEWCFAARRYAIDLVGDVRGLLGREPADVERAPRRS